MMKLSRHSTVAQNGMNSVVLTRNGKAWVVLAPTANGAALARAVRGSVVERVICLNYRASLHGGLYPWVAQGAAVAAPKTQADLFTHPEKAADAGPFHRYAFHPDADVLPEGVFPDVWLDAGSVLEFEGIRLSFADMGGDTVGELACVIDDGEKKIAVCGDVLCADGTIPFLHRMTKEGVVGVSAYHSFLLAKDDFIQGLQALRRVHAIVPARGDVAMSPAHTVDTVTRRLAALYDNYASTNALRHYFPAMFPMGTLSGVKAKKTRFPTFIIPHEISYLIVSPSKRGILVDCGQAKTVEFVTRLLREGKLAALDACFITHYHDDHVDHVNALRSATGCRVWSTASQADVLKNPWRYRLPALSHESVEIETLPDDRPFAWDGMTLTAFDLPGQSVHHGALLADHRGKRYLFCGDSFAPTGIDDYCAGNRNFLSGGRGYFACLDLVKKYRPDWIVNQHIPTPFRFSASDLATLRRRLTRRKALMKAITPWQGIDMATDPAWIRLMPETPTFAPGQRLRIDIHVTSHVATPTKLLLRFETHCGIAPPATARLTLDGATCGYLRPAADSDKVISRHIAIPASFTGKRLPVTVHATLDNAYCGSFFCCLYRTGH